MKKLLAIFLILSGTTFSQISPGELTKAHAKYEGISNCTLCHSLGEKLTNQNCLACHKEIKQKIDLNRGYHSSNDVKSKDCWKCHSEHNGRNFEIVRFNKKDFDHLKTSFTLSGKHLNLDCDKCHTAKFVKETELKKRTNTFLGLDQKCGSCHEDYHQKTLGDNCNSCHNSESFKPAKYFDHNKARYRLNGAHIKVACDKCHPKEISLDKTFQQFKGLSFNSCNDCHKDPHLNKFGNDCEKCHNSQSFYNINKKNFDHNNTNFSLIGKHIPVECSKCHKINFKIKLQYKNCADCHNDYHEGQFDLKRDCKECHNEFGFSPSRFTIDEHTKTNYPLIGSHLAAACTNCHLINKKWNFKIAKKECTDCHNDIHGEELRKDITNNKGCDFCHNTASWKIVSFNHDVTKFKLLGKHFTAECNACHLSKESPEQKKIYFRSTQSTCVSCHKDIHHGQFVKNYQNDCNRCHSSNNWTPEKFDHNKTAFALTGAHVKLECRQCHKQAEVNGLTFIIYSIGKNKCVDCHT